MVWPSVCATSAPSRSASATLTPASRAASAPAACQAARAAASTSSRPAVCCSTLAPGSSWPAMPVAGLGMPRLKLPTPKSSSVTVGVTVTGPLKVRVTQARGERRAAVAEAPAHGVRVQQPRVDDAAAELHRAAAQLRDGEARLRILVLDDEHLAGDGPGRHRRAAAQVHQLRRGDEHVGRARGPVVEIGVRQRHRRRGDDDALDGAVVPVDQDLVAAGIEHRLRHAEQHRHRAAFGQALASGSGSDARWPWPCRSRCRRR